MSKGWKIIVNAIIWGLSGIAISLLIGDNAIYSKISPIIAGGAFITMMLFLAKEKPAEEKTESPEEEQKEEE